MLFFACVADSLTQTATHPTMTAPA